MHEFHRGPYETAVGPAEMLVEIRVPLRAARGSAYLKVDRRVGDWAVVAAGAALDARQTARSRGAGLALAAVGGDITVARGRAGAGRRAALRSALRARGASSRGPRANRSPINADPRTTNGTSSASSRSACCERATERALQMKEE